jgi:hypothetical protein
VYSVKHGEKTLLFKKKGEGESPSATETAPNTQDVAPPQKFKTAAKAVGKVNKVWQAKKKETTGETPQSAVEPEVYPPSTASHSVEVSHKPTTEEPK